MDVHIWVYTRLQSIHTRPERVFGVRIPFLFSKARVSIIMTDIYCATKGSSLNDCISISSPAQREESQKTSINRHTSERFY